MRSKHLRFRKQRIDFNEQHRKKDWNSALPFASDHKLRPRNCF